MRAEICETAPRSWKILPLEEVCIKITSGGTPSRTRPDFYEGGLIPWVKTQELTDDWIHNTDEKITEEAISSSSAKLLPANTVLMAMYGATVGQLGMLKSPMTCNQACCALIVDPAKADFRFLYYQLRHSRTQLKSLATGGAQQNLSGALIKSLLYPFPSIDEQKRIAGILGSLDDKIELNRKMNETLEQMASALFKSWFVDFDPVHAKAERRQPAGMDKATADLFPDSFVDSELGKIPSGWKAGSLSELSEFSRESINPGESLSEIFDHYSLPSFDEGKAPKAEAGSEIKSNKLVVTKTCVLLSKLNPHIPRIWLPNLNVSRRSICSTEFIVAAATAGCTREYLYALFISEDFSRTYGTLVTGTTGSHQRIRAESVLQMRLPLAPAKLISSFTDTIAPMLNRVASNTKESQTLAELRDTLLPQLLNGDLKVA
jgi:type I restriction enzyme, S subunit